MLVFIWSSWDFKRILPGEFRGQSSTAERFGTWLHSAYIGAERSRNWIAERTNHNLLFSQIDSREKTSAFRPRHKHAEHRKPWISQRRLQSCSLWSICVNWVTREKVSPHRVILFWFYWLELSKIFTELLRKNFIDSQVPEFQFCVRRR